MTQAFVVEHCSYHTHPTTERWDEEYEAKEWMSLIGATVDKRGLLARIGVSL
jgi:hypothetical protein